jgi:hypothetical protein
MGNCEASTSQRAATSGNCSVHVAVLQAWYNDLRASRQEAHSGVAAGALGTRPPAWRTSSLTSRT